MWIKDLLLGNVVLQNRLCFVGWLLGYGSNVLLYTRPFEQYFFSVNLQELNCKITNKNFILQYTRCAHHYQLVVFIIKKTALKNGPQVVYQIYIFLWEFDWLPVLSLFGLILSNSVVVSRLDVSDRIFSEGSRSAALAIGASGAVPITTLIFRESNLLFSERQKP